MTQNTLNHDNAQMNPFWASDGLAAHQSGFDADFGVESYHWLLGMCGEEFTCWLRSVVEREGADETTKLFAGAIQFLGDDAPQCDVSGPHEHASNETLP